MLFSSLTFLFGFLPILLVFYFVIKNRKYRNIILLLFSLLFYAWGEPKYIILMLLTILVAYIFGILIGKDNKYKKIYLIICIVIMIANLVIFKYTNFILSNINLLTSSKIKENNLILPIGISFYTFQILSYIIDLYRGKVKVQKNFLSLAIYVSLFPQLIAGPIVRYETIENEINNRKESLADITLGLKRFIIGLGKKVIIANNMAILADNIFDKYTNSYGTAIIWIGVLSYTMQIYFDFSGYSDMAIGLGRIFGFHFLENFDYPYISKSITEFWRRWHFSLSSWFKDYVYIPLGGNRVSKAKWIRNIFIVWTLTGLWHGAAWNFIIWGIYYGLILILEKTLLNKLAKKVPKILNYIYTIILVMIGWMIFRTNNLKDIVVFLDRMFIYHKTDWLSIVSNNITLFVSAIFIIPAIILSFPLIKIIKNKIKKPILYNIIENIVLICILIICIMYLTSSSYNPFIYFRF